MGESPFFMCSFAVCEVNCVGRGRSRNFKRVQRALTQDNLYWEKTKSSPKGEGGGGEGGSPDRLDMPTSLTTK